MKKIQLNVKSELKLKNIKGFLERTVTSFGTGAKVDCPKEFLGKKVILVIIEDETHKD
jgi:putative transposon-encoded protein